MNQDEERPAEAAGSEAEGPDPTLRERLTILFGASRGFWLVNAVNFGDGIAYFGMLALLTLFLNKDVGFSTGWSTKSVSIFTGLVTITMALGGGWLSDRLGVRRALSLSMLIVLIGRIFLVASPLTATTGVVFTMAWIGLVVMGFGEGILQPALYSGVKEYTDKRTATLGYAFLYSIMNLGIVAGEFLSPLIRNWYAKSVQGLDVEQVPTAGIGGAFYFFIAVTVVVLAANVIFFTRRVELRDRIVVEEEEPASEPEISNWIGKLRSLPIMDLRFLFFIFILLPVRTLFAHQWLTMPFYVTRALPPEVGAKWEWVNMINPLVIVIGVPLIAAMTARRRVVDMMIVGTLVSALSSFLLVPHPNTIFLVTYMVIWSLGEAMWSSRFLEYVADIAPAPRVGIYMGLAGIPWFLAKFVTGFYAGNMLDKFVPAQGPQDPGTMWLIYGLTALVSPIGLILARRWLLAGELGREQAAVAE